MDGGILRIALAKPRRGAGGGTTMALHLAEGLRARGHDLLLLCHPAARIRARALDAGFRVSPVLVGRDLPQLAAARSALALLRHRSDVLLSFMAHPDDLLFSVPAARWLNRPVVVRRGLAGPLRLRVRERRALAGARRLVAVSHAAARELADALPGSAPPLVIPNGTDLGAVSAATPADLGLPEGGVAVGFVGRLHREKGIFDLALAWHRVAASVPQAHLILVGDGEHEERLRAALRGAPRVRWLGYRRDTAAIHRALDVLVLPTYREGFPNVVVEAMAAGTAVVSTRVDGPLEAVEEGVTGLLVPPGDPGALADALIRLASDAGARERLGAAAAHRARERFDLERVVDAYEAVLAQAVRE